MGSDFWVVISIVKAIIEALSKLFGEPEKVARDLRNEKNNVA